MKMCKVCWKKPRLERKVNGDGFVFCSDDCYDEFEHACDDFNHPYIDDYDAIRFEYTEWMKNYEDDLYKNFRLYGSPKKEEIIEAIESVLEEFDNYRRLEGTDGIFSAEIYHYLQELENLKSIIMNWQANERELKKRRKALMEEHEED